VPRSQAEPLLAEERRNVLPLLDQLDRSSRRFNEAIPEGTAAAELLREHIAEVPGHSLHVCVQESFLAREVAIERRPGTAGGLGDVRHSGALNSVAREHLARRRQDAIDRQLLPFFVEPVGRRRQ